MTATPARSTQAAAAGRAWAGVGDELTASSTRPTPTTTSAATSRGCRWMPSTGTASTAVTAIDAAMQDSTMNSGRCCRATAAATAPTRSSAEPAMYQRSVTRRSRPEAESVAEATAPSGRRRVGRGLPPAYADRLPDGGHPEQDGGAERQHQAQEHRPIMAG